VTGVQNPNKKTIFQASFIWIKPFLSVITVVSAIILQIEDMTPAPKLKCFVGL
jgi:hypothetical protein